MYCVEKDIFIYLLKLKLTLLLWSCIFSIFSLVTRLILRKNYVFDRNSLFYVFWEMVPDEWFLICYVWWKMVLRLWIYTSPTCVPPHNMLLWRGCILVGLLVIALNFILLFILLPLIIVSFELMGLLCVQVYLAFLIRYSYYFFSVDLWCLLSICDCYDHTKLVASSFVQILASTIRVILHAFLVFVNSNLWWAPCV